MPDLKYDVLGIGNAIVDVIARAEDDFLVKQGMHKGGMALIDEPRAQAIYQAMGQAVEKSGGSAANTIVGVAGFGARAAFVGKVKDDKLGQAFATTSATPASPSTRRPPRTARRPRAAT
jgi:adenosine kinase